jgi:Mor family transcriptional regulator
MKFTRILFLISSLLLISSQIVSASYILEKEEQSTHALFLLQDDTPGHQEEAALVHDLAEVKEVEEELKKDKEKQGDPPLISDVDIDIKVHTGYSVHLSFLEAQALHLQKNLQTLYCSFLI